MNIDSERHKFAFSLVELLVAMAIIAVLIAIATYGIQILQRNGRNTVRRKSNEDLAFLIEDIESSTLKSVGYIEFYSATNTIIFKESLENPEALRSITFRSKFDEIHIETTQTCSNKNDSTGYGAAETNAKRLWICFNSITKEHGVRIENGKSEEAELEKQKVSIVNKPIVSSSGQVNYKNYAQIYSVKNINDGDENSAWRTQTSGRTKAVIDLGGKLPISTINYSINWDSKSGYNQKAKIIFYTSNDNVKWNKVAEEITTNGKRIRSIDLPNDVEGQYIKFEWANPPGGGWNGWGNVYEISVQ